MGGYIPRKMEESEEKAKRTKKQTMPLYVTSVPPQVSRSIPTKIWLFFLTTSHWFIQQRSMNSVCVLQFPHSLLHFRNLHFTYISPQKPKTSHFKNFFFWTIHQTSTQIICGAFNPHISCVDSTIPSWPTKLRAIQTPFAHTYLNEFRKMTNLVVPRFPVDFKSTVLPWFCFGRAVRCSDHERASSSSISVMPDVNGLQVMRDHLRIPHSTHWRKIKKTQTTSKLLRNQNSIVKLVLSVQTHKQSRSFTGRKCQTLHKCASTFCTFIVFVVF